MKKDVVRNEKILNESKLIFEELMEVLDRVEKNEDDLQGLRNYYMSEAYFKDIEISNQRDEYRDIPCGVLSEDEVFDLLGTSYPSAIRMLEMATRIIKNH